MSNNYDDDFAIMIQCYQDCGRDVELAIKMYKNKYPDRKKRLLYLLWNIVKNDDDSKKENHSVEFIKSLDDSIANYFVKNSHATIRKAACIFSVPIRYVAHILVKREEEIKAMKLQNEIIREQESLKERIRETIEETKLTLKLEILGRSDSEEEINTTTTLLDYASNSQGEFNIKVEEDESNIEASESETADGDNVYYKTETKKRKKKIFKCGNSKKIRASKSSQDASSGIHRPYQKRTTIHFPPHSSSTSYSPLSQNSTVLDTQVRKPIVYTTRLEEMTIWNKNIDHLDNAVIISEVLKESKPQFNNIICNRKVIKSMSLGLIDILLNKLTNKHTAKGNFEKAFNNNNDDDISIVTDENETAQKTDDKHMSCIIQAEDVSGLHNNTDVIVINNMVSNQRDTYVISGDKLLEYHCTKLNTDGVERTSKTTFTLNVCCWFGRQKKVETMWPSNKYSFSRFLKSRHKCILDKCACCCKPLNDCTSELNPSFHKSANNDVIKESYSKHNLISTALNYKKPVANEDMIIKNANRTYSNRIEPLKLPLANATRLSITDSSERKDRNEYYEIGGNKDITRFHVHNHWFAPHTRARCKVCTNLIQLCDSKHSINASACCKWKRDWILRPFVSPNSLRFLQNVNRYQYDKCSACDLQSKSVKKITVHSFSSVPRIGHRAVFEKRTFSKFGLKVRPPDVDNTSLAGEMPVVTSTFEVKKKVILQCKQIPNLIFEINGLKDQEVNNIVDKLMHMHCTVKDDLKVVGLFDSSFQSATTEELQMFAQIIQHIQNRLKVTPLPSGSSLSLIAEVTDDFKNSNNQSKFQTDFVNQGTVVNSRSNASNMGPLVTITSHNQNTLPIIIGEASIASHCSNVTSQNRRSFVDTSGTAESIANVNTFVNDNNEVTDKLKTPDSFEKFYKHSKRCYAESFKSYVNYEHTVENEDITIPKISSVFSLQSSIQCETPANESVSTETVLSLPSTSYFNKEIAQNKIINANVETNVIPYPHSTLPPMVQTTGQEMIICDLKTGQLFNLIPVNPNTILESSIKQNIVTIQPDGKGDSQLKLLPLESVRLNDSNPSIPIITTNYESMEPESILPDILNDIPKHVIVKSEPNNEVIVLDSD